MRTSGANEQMWLMRKECELTDAHSRSFISVGWTTPPFVGPCHQVAQRFVPVLRHYNEQDVKRDS